MIKHLDAGGIVMISGKDAAEVQAALNERLSNGASLLSSPSSVGGTWVAAYTPSSKPQSADQTTTLTLLSMSNSSSGAKDECQIDMLGFTWMITGSTEAAVASKVKALADLGAKSLGEIEETEDGQWLAACEVIALYEKHLDWVG